MSYIDQDLESAFNLDVADIDDDGDLDIAATGVVAGDVVWYEAPNWTKHFIDDALDGAWGLQIIDMDDDNDLDVVASGPFIGDVNWYEYIPPSGIDDENNLPMSVSLAQNYPNPFNASTKISFTLESPGFVNLAIYDLLGREVKLLISEVKQAGEHSLIFDASELNSGVYFYRLKVDELAVAKRMLLLK